jgi:hypothetical protein
MLRRKWENVIKMDFREVGCGWNWLRIIFSGGIWYYRY